MKRSLRKGAIQVSEMETTLKELIEPLSLLENDLHIIELNWLYKTVLQRFSDNENNKNFEKKHNSI